MDSMPRVCVPFWATFLGRGSAALTEVNWRPPLGRIIIFGPRESRDHGGLHASPSFSRFSLGD